MQYKDKHMKIKPFSLSFSMVIQYKENELKNTTCIPPHANKEGYWNKKGKKLMVHPGIHILDNFLRKKNDIYEYIIMSRSNFIYAVIRFSSEGYIAMHV